MGYPEYKPLRSQSLFGLKPNVCFLYRLIFGAVFIWLVFIPCEVYADENLSSLRGVWQADFNREASCIITQMRGGGISLWDTTTQAAVCKDIGRGKETAFYVLRPDRKVALIAFQARGARLADLTTGELVSPLLDVAVQESDPPNVRFSPDFKTLIVFDHQHSVHVFDTRNGKLRTKIIRSRSKSASEEGDNHRNVKFTSDGASCFISDTNYLITSV